MWLAWKEGDSEADRPSGMSRKHRMHSRFYWFTEFCNSQCLSHFAAPFISVHAKTFITEGCTINGQGTNPASYFRKKLRSDDSKAKQMWNTQRVCHPPNPNCPGFSPRSTNSNDSSSRNESQNVCIAEIFGCMRMILPQVHLRKPCYDFSFL